MTPGASLGLYSIPSSFRGALQVNAVGLFDLDRQPRAVAGAYRMLLEQFGRITVLPQGEMFELTGRPATRRVEV